jgi:hypothetical protein
MTKNSDRPEVNPLGKLISVLVLFAAALYFTGWVYRWAYFSMFQLDVTNLKFPNESFYLAAFQTFFGEPLAIVRSILCLAFTIGAIFTTLHWGQKWVGKSWRRLRLSFNDQQKQILGFLATLLNEIIIVLFVLTALFCLARWQAQADAWKDTVNDTSSLPVVTLVLSKDAPLGRKLDDPLTNPADFRVVGDRKSYDRLLGQELSNPNKPMVWRLLLRGDGYAYIFPALPQKNPKLMIPLVIVYERDNGVQLTILGHSQKSWSSK